MPFGHIKTTVDALKEDLEKVLDEHGLDVLSFTVTDSKKRRHGQLQFETTIDGGHQDTIPGTTEKA